MNLFSEYSDREVSAENAKKINGLLLHFEFVSREEEEGLISFIDSNTWSTELKRRVQHYGYKYDYTSRSIRFENYLGSLPVPFLVIAEKIKGLTGEMPNQAIVNEYVDSQGIAPHIDCEPCFGDTIVSLSLNGTAVMKFRNPGTTEAIDIFLERRSLLVMKGDARYNWTHEIPGRKFDNYNNTKILRGRRISITFRNAIVSC